MARRIRRTSGPLDLRTQAILRAVIEEYVATATPIGSAALVERYGLGVSSATVRNILAELEMAGFLTHPHTSAGRIPTDAGYRYYVESFGEGASIPPVEQLMIRHQFGQVEFASEHWFRLAATTLASMTRAAGIATPAKTRSARVRRVDLVVINDRLASLIIVLREGALKQVLVSLDSPADQDALTQVAALLNATIVDQSADRIAARLARYDDADPAALLARKVGERIVRTLREFDAATIEELFSDGLLNVMEAPSSPRATSFGGSSRHSRTGPTSAVSSRRSPGPARSASSSDGRTGQRTCERSRSCWHPTAGRGRPSVSSACSGRRDSPTPRRSAPSGSSRAS